MGVAYAISREEDVLVLEQTRADQVAQGVVLLVESKDGSRGNT